MNDQGARTGWGSSVTHKRTRDSQDDVVTIDSSDEEDRESYNPRQKSRPAGTTDVIRIHGVDLIMLQPPAGFKNSQPGSDVKPDMAWLQRRPIGSPGGGAAVGASLRQRGGGALQKRLEQEDREEQHEGTAGDDDESTQGLPESDEEVVGEAMQGVTHANASGEARVAPEAQVDDLEEIFSTADHDNTSESVIKGVEDSIRIILGAIHRHGPNSDGAKAVLQERVERVSHLLKPIYPIGQDNGAMARLLETLVRFTSDETEALVTEVIEGLKELHEKLYGMIIIDDKLRSASLAPAGASRSPGRAMVPVNMRGASTDVEDIFQRQLTKCGELVDAYLGEETKTEGLENHRQKRIRDCRKAMDGLQDKLEAYQKRLADHTVDERDARKALLDKDLEFKARFSEVNPSRELRQLMSQSDGELEIISRLLDATTADPGLLRERAELQKTLERREHELRVADHRVNIMEAFIGVVDCVMRAGDKLGEAMLTEATQEVNNGKAQLARELRQNVAEAAVKLQNVIEFHERRKRKLEGEIEKKGADIREQKALFGSECPAHIRDLELHRNELRTAANKSHSIISTAFDQSTNFHKRLEELLPPALARELDTLFQKNMACSSAFIDYTPAGTQTPHGLVLTNAPASSSQQRPERPPGQPAADSKPAAKPMKPAAKQTKPAAKPQAQGNGRAPGGKDDKTCIIS